MNELSELTEREAYLAMFAFLEHHHNMTKSDDIGTLLGSMSLLRDGETADPAIWSDWCRAIREVRTGSVNADLEFK